MYLQNPIIPHSPAVLQAQKLTPIISADPGHWKITSAIKQSYYILEMGCGLSKQAAHKRAQAELSAFSRDLDQRLAAVDRRQEQRRAAFQPTYDAEHARIRSMKEEVERLRRIRDGR
jgi:hypothetical protein